MIKGIIYTALAKYSGVLFTLIISAVLARLLTPEEFGIVALVSVFITFFKLLGDMGIGPAIIQKKELTDEDIRSIFSFSFLVGAVLATTFYFSAFLISEFYKEPELVNIVHWLSLSVFFNILIIVPRAINRKSLQFKKLAVVSITVQLFTGVIAIWMAYKDYSYYALVFQSILSAIFNFLIFYSLYPVLPILKIKLGPLKTIAKFSSYQFGFNFINYFSRNLDSLLIGKYLGSAPLGFYNKSYTLMMLPVKNLTHVITPVLHPVLSNYQQDFDYIFKSYLKVLKLLALLGFPLSAFLYFAAPELILLVFGPQWNQSVPVFKILALTVGIQILLSSTGSIFQAIDRTDLLFLSGFLSAVLMISGISYGVFWGGDISSVAFGLAFAFYLNFLQGFYILFKIGLDASLFSFLRILCGPVLIGLGLSVLLYGVEVCQTDSYIINLVLKTAVFVSCLIGMIFAVKDYRVFIKQKLKIKGRK